MRTLLLLLALIALCFTVTGCEDDDGGANNTVWLPL
jgi:predicted small secreted protein